jgi:hypothetical protein
VKQAKVFNALRLLDETNTLLIKGLLKVVKVLKGTIDNSFVREMPEMLGGLKFRGIRWQGDGLESVWKV